MEFERSRINAILQKLKTIQQRKSNRTLPQHIRPLLLRNTEVADQDASLALGNQQDTQTSLVNKNNKVAEREA